MSLFNISSDISQDIPAFSTTVCPSWFRQELFNNAKNITIIIILGFINAIVVAGNILVVLAVFASAKLRTVTNFLIVSLAISDLLVGLAVLPYSISLEVLEVWIFGELWCQMWLAVDVWLCTASILNLCAISIDRYLAITRPVHYRTIMSTMKVRLLIAAVWMLSFIICFPPLVGWNDRVQDSGRCPKPQCALITNQGYVIYSALGSFYIPMLVMLFFYYRIYVVARNHNKSSKRNARWHAKRFRTEAKATKTVGIIVGGFILCWLPFFTVYLIMGFCETCIPEVLFKVFFYLGYCNSALNPIIYGIISKDFRAAFKKILFRCTFNDESVASLIRHIHMPTFTEEETHVGDSSSQT
ncbi:unnamed protein product [Larinioides sclopetarius]|uniref:G-protein coupled receptors family 1 profile domain-containing protein n=1 Tax=Larinioides sclopetarius TaxID=280406 RepID=A0AAV1ZQU9_9ARAC